MNEERREIKREADETAGTASGEGKESLVLGVMSGRHGLPRWDFCFCLFIFKETRYSLWE